MMKNRLVAILVAVCMVCFVPATGLSAASAQAYSQEGAITLARTLNIMVGDEQGNLNLDQSVSRAEFTKMAVAMSQYRNMVATTGTTSVFRDCTFKHWAAPYVRVAVTNGMVNGYPDGTFRPENTVSLEEAITVMLKLLGYTNADFGTSWPYGQMGIAKNEHILDNVDKNIGDALTRADVLKIVYNTLVANPKSAQAADAKYLEQLECELHEDAVIIATNEQNNSVGAGYVLTSAGTFKLGENFDDDFVGRKGDLIIKNNDFAAFMPSSQIAEKHVVYSKLNDTLVTYYNGSMTNFSVDANVTAYQDTTKTTYSGLKNSISTGDTIYLMKDWNGNVDYLTVATDNLQGPYTVANGNWYTRFTSDADGLTIMYNGVKGDYTDVKVNDVVYYLADINTVFTYNRKVTGVYEKATPNKDMPTSVTVSGVEYTLESAAAFDKLSSNGSCKFGDTVTLLMGKDGQVADVATSKTAQETLVGYLTGTGTKEFTNADGDTYTSLYASLVCPDGSTLEVITNSNYSAYINRVMAVHLNDGVGRLSEVKGGNTIYGKVSVGDMTIGSWDVDDSVKIIDVLNYGEEDQPSGYTTTFMQRLDGMTLSAQSVLYSKRNASGKVSELILKNVTGDAYSYGIIASVNESGSGEGMSVSNQRYTCDVAGKQYTCNINYGSQFKQNSVASFHISGNSIIGMKALQRVSSSVSAINEGSITAGGKEYLLSDKVAVYKLVSGNTRAFTILPLNELKNERESYSIAAYYDKEESRGGRIRVLVATPR